MTDGSGQHKPAERSPRLKLTYGVEIGGAIEMRELPFVLGVLSDLSGKPDQGLPRLRDRKFIEIDRGNFNEVMEGMHPALAYSVDNKLANDDTKLDVALRFNSIEAFEPEQVAQQIEALRPLLETRRRLSGLLTRYDNDEQMDDNLQELITRWDLIQNIYIESASTSSRGATMAEAKDQAQPQAQLAGNELKYPADSLHQASGKVGSGDGDDLCDRSNSEVTTSLQEVMKRTTDRLKNLKPYINARIADLDGLISRQVNEIIHHEHFQKLEASWRSLHFLVMSSETCLMLKIKVLSCAKEDLRRDLERASDFDQCAIFRKVYDEEFGTFGGAPFGALIGDYEFERSPQDVEMLANISSVAAAAHAPFFAAASPTLLGLESFTDISASRDLSRVFDTVQFAKYKSFRESQDSRFVALTLPHMLLRLPYGPDTVPVEGFNFREDMDGETHSKYLWGSAAYALGSRITDAFAKYGWCAAIRGIEGGGLVEGLPTHTFRTDDGEEAFMCPTEIAIFDRLEKELSDLGFIPLCHCRGTNNAAFFGDQSCHKSGKNDSPAATAIARRSSEIRYTMAISRFAHYLKAMARDKMGSFVSSKDCADFLNQWIGGYVFAGDTDNERDRAKFPLREGRIEVSEIRGKPGTYMAVAFLSPRFQLDELTFPLRLVTELPRSARLGR